ncbi:MAG TPA: hypothetical protein VGI99_12900, partial [Gemmataceae bacterium]
KTQPAVLWYLLTLGARPSDASEPAWSLRVIRIDNDQVLAELKLPRREGLRYSFNEVSERMQDLREKTAKAVARKKHGNKLDLFEIKILELAENYQFIGQVAEGFGKDSDENQFHLIPPSSEGGTWASLGVYQKQAEDDALNAYFDSLREQTRPRLTDDSLRGILKKIGLNEGPEQIARTRAMVLDTPLMDLRQHGRQFVELVLDLLRSELTDAEVRKSLARSHAVLEARLHADPRVALWTGMIDARRANNPTEFNARLAEYRETQLANVPAEQLKNENREVQYNRVAPFYRCIGLYIMAFLLAAVGFVFNAAEWPRLGDAFRRSAGLVLVLTLFIHGAALITRMDLMDRWTVFVTNLYSSAIFISFGCVVLGLILERIFPIGIGNIVGSVLGAATLLIAHNIGTEDTLEMKEAVLDTNFWLATHVTTVTFGYTATFVAGFLGAAYLFLMFGAVIRDSFRVPGAATADRLLAYGAAAAGIVFIPLAVGWGMFDALAQYEVIPDTFAELLRYGMVAIGGLFFLALLGARATADSVDSHGKPVASAIPR